MGWHKESARSSEEVPGVSGIVQELQNLHESGSQQCSAKDRLLVGEVAHQLRR